MGRGKILKILSVGKLKVNIQQKDGSGQVIILNEVHFVPDLYCNLFSITTDLEENFVLSGGRNECLTLRKDHTIIRFDRNIRSGGGRLLGVRMTPTKLPMTKPMKISCDKAHRILNHSGERETRATAAKLGWSITNHMTECVHCAEAKAKIQDIAKTTDSPATCKGDVIYLDICYIKHDRICCKRFCLRFMDLFTKMMLIFFLKKKSDTSE